MGPPAWKRKSWWKSDDPGFATGSAVAFKIQHHYGTFSAGILHSRSTTSKFYFCP